MKRAVTVINNPVNNNYNVWQIGNNISLYDWEVLPIAAVSGAVVTLANAADAEKVNIGDVVFGGTLPSSPANPATVLDVSGTSVTLSAAPGSVTSLTFGSLALGLSTVLGGQHSRYVSGSLVFHNPTSANNAPSAFAPATLGLNPSAISSNLGGGIYKLVLYVFKAEGIGGQSVEPYELNFDTALYPIAQFQQQLAQLFVNAGGVVTTNTPTNVQATFSNPGATIAYVHNGGSGSVTTFSSGSVQSGDGGFLKAIYENNLENEYTGKSKISTGNTYRVYYAKSEVPVKSLTGSGTDSVEHIILVNNANTANANSYHTRITALLQ